MSNPKSQRVAYLVKKLHPKNWGKPPVVNPANLNKDLPDEYVSKKKDAEGGVGAFYKVTIKDWGHFRAAVLGHGYDIDGFYGWQCWDGAALLWQQLGLSLITGNGNAIGCWDLKRNVNKYNKFDLVTSVNQLLPGDVVCMRPNHIGFFENFDGPYMIIVAQNQGGKPGPNGGSSFNRVRITKSAFAGAFRLKAWHKPAPAPTAKKYVTVQKNWGLSNVAMAAGYKDYGSDKRWQAISDLNHGGKWTSYNARLKPGQKIRVK